MACFKLLNVFSLKNEYRCKYEAILLSLKLVSTRICHVLSQSQLAFFNFHTWQTCEYYLVFGSGVVGRRCMETAFPNFFWRASAFPHFCHSNLTWRCAVLLRFSACSSTCLINENMTSYLLCSTLQRLWTFSFVL